MPSLYERKIKTYWPNWATREKKKITLWLSGPFCEIRDRRAVPVSCGKFCPIFQPIWGVLEKGGEEKEKVIWMRQNIC